MNMEKLLLSALALSSFTGMAQIPAAINTDPPRK